MGNPRQPQPVPTSQPLPTSVAPSLPALTATLQMKLEEAVWSLGGPGHVKWTEGS